jgi:uncharacterized protein (TIGR03435 family)
VTIAVWARVLLVAGTAPLFSAAQPKAAPLSFEVASVKPAAPPIATKDEYTAGYNAGMRAGMAEQGLRVTGLRVNITDNTLRDLIRLAYQVKNYQIVGPGWTASEKYEIAALMPAGSERSQAPLMLQTLLKDRFHLELRRETRKLAAYALVVVKGGPKLSSSAGANGGRGGIGMATMGVFRARNSSLTDLADFLTKHADRPVIDKTGISGRYDFELNLLTDASAAVDEPSFASSIATPLKKIGLKLEGRTLQLETLVIERADRVPVEN